MKNIHQIMCEVVWTTSIYIRTPQTAGNEEAMSRTIAFMLGFWKQIRILLKVCPLVL